MKKLTAILICLLLLSSFFVKAEENGNVTVSSECDYSDVTVPLDAYETVALVGQTLDIKAKSVILMEPYTGEILYESNSDEKLAPASITKIMSLLLVMEAIDRGDMKLTDEISASEHACSMGGSQIWLKPNETMTVDDLLKASVIASANDAIVALGEAVAGSEEGFVAMMNERAKELGMTNTHYVNCCGLDADGHLTSAHDVAIASCELIKHDLIKKYSTVWMDSLRNGKSELVNTNKLVRFYDGCTGLKTGTTGTAKYCLSATAERNGMALVAVVMAGESSKDRFNGAKKLLDFGFANYSFSTIGADIKDDMTVDISDGVKKKLDVSADKTMNILLPKNSKKEITRDITINDNIKAPIKKGDVVGNVNISYDGEQLGQIPITSSEDVEKMTILVSIRQILYGLFQL